MEFKLQWQFVLCFIVMSTADNDYENRLTKLWSMSGASDGAGSAVVNVTSASIVIQPSSYSRPKTQNRKYAFRPRAIPLKKEEPQIERNAYYSQDNVKNYKSEVLFPGDYVPIATEKSGNSNGIFGPAGPFQPQTIPLIRNEEFQKRSLDVNEEPIIEKPEGFSEPTASRRSISDYFGVEEDEDEEDDEDGEYEAEGLEEDTELKSKNKKKKKLKTKKLKKYMLPLLLAYKMKYFALVPVMIGGLVLLVGATGLAGFFFALFAAVMGLQKGDY